MKVVLFCGGFGMRMRDYSDQVPKPLVEIGSRPVLWHLMKYYAHYGHTDFILCLGHGANVIKNYFRNYDEAISNDFVLTKGGKDLELLRRDIDDWRITFVGHGPLRVDRRAAADGPPPTWATTRCSSPTTRTACPTSISPAT